MENISAKDLQISREKSRTFRGTFRIPLDKLQPEDLPQNPRQRDSKNVARLLNVFRKEECQRLGPENSVLALASRSTLPQVPNSRGVGAGEEPPLFILETPLTVLYRAHRLEAARKFLKGSDRWWVADLHSNDLNSNVKNELREQDPNSSTWFDGDVVRQIRLSTLAGDSPRREKFLARLSKSKRKCFLRLEALPGIFSNGWDSLVPFAGLWPSVQVGTFPRLLNLHCPEEIIRCSRRIKETWTHIIGDQENDQVQLDANTVAILQGRCPYLSKEDRTFVQMRMLAGDLFPAVKDDDRRSEIFSRICSTDNVIPSIYMCIENAKWLEPGVRILKELLPENGKGSISQQFSALHNGQANMKVQTSEFASEDRTSSSGNSFWLSYRQIFLFALRHFPVMDGQAPRKDAPKQSSPSPGIQPRWWHEILSLASESGYQGLRRKYRDRQAADATAVEDCVRAIIPPKYYKIDPISMRRIVQLNCQLLHNVPYAERIKVTPELTSDNDECGSDISDRYGRPHDHSFQADQESLFLDYIYSASYSTVPKRYLTSFAVKRDFFHSFFGSKEDDLGRQPRFKSLQDTVPKDAGTSEAVADRNPVDQDKDKVEVIGSEDSIDEEVDDGAMDPESIESQLPSQSILTLGNSADAEEEDRRQPRQSGSRSSLHNFGQQGQDNVVSTAEASRLLFKIRTGRIRPLFTVLSPVADNQFHKRQTDSLDDASIVTALDLPSNCQFIARDNGKRLKMTALAAIVDAARSQDLHTVLRVNQPNVQHLIRQIENHETLRNNSNKS